MLHKARCGDTMAPPLNHERIARSLPAICQDIRVACLPVHLAAAANGIPSRTFERYWARGKEVLDQREDEETPRPEETDDERVLARLALAVREAQATKVRARLARIAQGDAGWQGSAWILERSPDTRAMFSPPKRLELSGPGGGPVEVQVTAEQAAADLDRLLSPTPDAEPG